jgi:flagellar hook assembly protein FlgD
MAYEGNRWFARSGKGFLSATQPGPVVPAPKAPKKTLKKNISGTRGKYYQQLSVVVDNPRDGLVTVRVLDGQGREIRMLFAGILPAGRRTFAWDGKTGQKSPAPPGRYNVEIKSGSDVMRREIQLEPDKLSP